jgi:large subunit ribosomal protein L10
MRVAKNTLIVKALQQLDAEKYSGIMDAFHGVTALMFSESPKEPALLISTIRSEYKTDKPVLKAALIGEEIYMGNESLSALTKHQNEERINWRSNWIIEISTFSCITSSSIQSGQKLLRLNLLLQADAPETQKTAPEAASE